MWRIYKIYDDDDIDKYVSFKELFEGHEQNSLVVYLIDDKTKEKRQVKLGLDRDSFVKELAFYDPYGMIDEKKTLSILGGCGHVLIAVPNYAYDFLSCVAAVDEVLLNVYSHEFQSIKYLDAEYRCLDDNNSLVECLCSGYFWYCTLFDVAVLHASSWCGDELYFYGSDSDVEDSYYCYRIRFCDVQRAKRILAKATLAYRNPLKEFVERVGF